MTDYKKKYIKYKLKYLHLIRGEPKGVKVREIVRKFESPKLPSQSSQPKQASRQQKQNSQASQSSQASRQPKQDSQASQASQASQQEIIDLKKCSKLEYFKTNKIENGEYFDEENFLKKREELKEFEKEINQPTCFINFKNLITGKIDYKDLSDENKKKFSLLKQFDEFFNLLADYVEFLQIFNETPYNEKKLVDEITSYFNKFNFNFSKDQIYKFVIDFLRFLLELVKKIINLFTQVLSVKYDKITEFNLEKFKYFALKFTNYYEFHKKSFVYFKPFFAIMIQPYQKIFLLLKEMQKIVKGKIEKLFDHINTYGASMQNLMAEREFRVRQPIIPLCKQILVLLSQTRCEQLKNMITLFNKIIEDKHTNNQSILKEFYSIISFFISSDFSCSNPKKIKLDVYSLLKQIADIFIFFEPEQKPEITKKLIDAFKTLSMIQKTQQSKNDKIDFNKLKELIDDLEVILLSCAGKDLLISKFKKFKEELNFLIITQVDIKNLSIFESLVDSKSDFICYNEDRKKNIKPEIKIKLKNIKDTLKHISSIKSSKSLPSRSTSPPKSRSTSPPSREPPPIPLFVN